MFCNTVISRPVISANETNRGVYLLCSSAAEFLLRPPDNVSGSLEIHQINIAHMERWWAWLVEGGNQSWLARIVDQAVNPVRTCWLAGPQWGQQLWIVKPWWLRRTDAEALQPSCWWLNVQIFFEHFFFKSGLVLAVALCSFPSIVKQAQQDLSPSHRLFRIIRPWLSYCFLIQNDFSNR